MGAKEKCEDDNARMTREVPAAYLHPAPLRFAASLRSLQRVREKRIDQPPPDPA